MATPTLTNSLNHYQLFARIVLPVAMSTCAKPQHFLVFPTGNSDYPWRIAGSATNRTVSQHKSLVHALRKCTRLNYQCDDAPLDPQKITPSGFPDASSNRAY